MMGAARLLAVLLLREAVRSRAACDANRSSTVNPSTGMPYCVRVGLFKKGGSSNDYFTEYLSQTVLAACMNEIEGVEFDVRETDLLWGGGVDAVAAGDLDIFVGTIWILRKRVRIVDFSAPFLSETIGLVYMKPDVSLSPTFFMQPFSMEVWIAWFASFILAWIAIMFTELIHCYGKGTPGSSKHRATDMVDLDDKSGTVFRTLWWSLGLPFGTQEQQPSTGAGKTVQFSMQFMFLILLSLYTANLASFLTVNQASSIVTRDQLLKKNVAVGPGDIGPFVSSMGGRPMVVSFDMAGRPALEGGFASVASQDTVILNTVATDCELDWINLNIPLESGFVFGQRAALNSLKRKFDSEILRLKEDGSLERWKSAGFPESQCLESGGVHALKIQFRQISGMYFILTGVMFLIVVMAFFERVVEKKAIAAEHALESAVRTRISHLVHHHEHAEGHPTREGGEAPEPARNDAPGTPPVEDHVPAESLSRVVCEQTSS